MGGRLQPYAGAVLGAMVLALLAAPTVAAESRAPGKKPLEVRGSPKPADARTLADRIDRRDAAPAGQGVMRFGDTEVRIGGRASVGYSYSGR